MKTTIERSALQKTLTHVQSVVERRNTIPILSNVHLEAKNGRLHMTATDLDIQITDSAEAGVQEEGKTTVPAQTLLEIVRKLPDGSQVSLETIDGRMKIVAGRSRFQLPTLPTDDFPILPRGDMGHTFTMTTKALDEALRNTRYAMSNEETRYYLNGIYIHEKGEGLLAAATDGHRLSRTAVDTGEQPLKGIPDVIMPRKAVGELMKLIGEYDGDIEISVSNSKIGFDIGHLSMTTKTVDGTFPDYTRVIPTANGIIVRADVKTLAAAIDRVTTIATEKTRAVKFKVENGLITLTVVSPENGNANDEVACENSGSIDIGFNARYLTETLGYIKSQNVEMRFADASAPVLIIDLDRPDDVNVLMPMRV